MTMDSFNKIAEGDPRASTPSTRMKSPVQFDRNQPVALTGAVDG
jgi:hypothetical protein